MTLASPRSGSPAVGRRIVFTRRGALDVRDGINILIFALAVAFLQSGHAVTVVATRVGSLQRLGPMYGLDTHPEYVEVEAASSGLTIEGLSPRWLTRGRQAVVERRPDLVLVHGALPFGLPGLVVGHAHDLGWSTAPRRLDPLRTLVKRFAANRTDRLVAASPEVRDGLARQLGRSPDQIAVVPPSVAVERAVRAPLGDREDAIVHTGTADYKDPAATIRAFARLDRPTTRLILEGEPTDDLRRQVAGLPPATFSRVELVGELPAEALRALLGSVRVASFPTRYTVPTASSTVVEAIAAGTPIVGSDRLSRLVLRDGQNGLAGADDAAMAGAFERLLADDAMWAAMSGANVAMASAFDAATVARTYLSWLEDPPT